MQVDLNFHRSTELVGLYLAQAYKVNQITKSIESFILYKNGTQKNTRLDDRNGICG